MHVDVSVYFGSMFRRGEGHVRHLAKYIDIPVSEKDQFVFWRGKSPSGERARTLREFVSVLEKLPRSELNGYLQRGDFSRWIADVFGDHPPAKTVQILEHAYRTENAPEILPNLVEAIRTRYDFIDPLLPRSSKRLVDGADRSSVGVDRGEENQ